MRRLAVALGAIAALAGGLRAQAPAPSTPTAPATAPAGQSAQSAPASLARLEIVDVGDSTVTIRVAPPARLKVGGRGIVVDPRRRDALVARFQVLSTSGDSAVALLTGLTTPVQRTHVALVALPRTHWYGERLFWGGAALGAVLGLAAGLAF